jgi:hypothetical protein
MSEPNPESLEHRRGSSCSSEQSDPLESEQVLGTFEQAQTAETSSRHGTANENMEAQISQGHFPSPGYWCAGTPFDSLGTSYADEDLFQDCPSSTRNESSEQLGNTTFCAVDAPRSGPVAAAFCTRHIQEPPYSSRSTTLAPRMLGIIASRTPLQSRPSLQNTCGRHFRIHRVGTLPRWRTSSSRQKHLL